MNKSNLQRIAEFNRLAGRVHNQPVISRDFMDQVDLIREEYNEVMSAHQSKAEIVKELADLIVVSAGAMYILGYDPDEVLDLVNTENESKWCYTLADAEASVEALSKGSRYEDVTYTLQKGLEGEDVYVIWGTVAETGNRKVLKGLHHQKAVIK